MPPASLQPLLANFKQKIDSILLHGDRLYIGYANGSLQIHSVALELPDDTPRAADETPDSLPSPPKIKHLTTKTNLSRRTIDQLGYHAQSNALVVLSDSQITLYDLPHLSKPTPLPQSRNAQSFAISQDGQLVVGCRKKVLVYTYDDKSKAALGLGQARELTLPHTPRLVLLPPTFDPAERFAHLCISPNESLILRITSTKPYLSVSEPTPPPVAAAKDEPGSAATAATSGLGMNMNALSGIGGYMGLGAKSKAIAGTVIGNEVLVTRDVAGVLYTPEGGLSRASGLEWPAPPDELSYHCSQILSILPSPPNNPPTLNLHLAPTLSHHQSLTIPTSTSTPHTLRLLSSSSPPIFVSTPTEKAALVAEGSTIWIVALQSVEQQLDGLTMIGRFEDALGLVSGEADAVHDKTARLAQLKALQSLSLFATAQFQSSIDAFLTLNIAPAKVIALFPANSVSGKIHVAKDHWTELYGAPFGALLFPEVHEDVGEEKKGLMRGVVGFIGGHAPLAKKSSDDALPTKEGSESEIESVAALPIGKTVEENETPRAALEALIHFLSDRRQKLSGAIALLSEPLPTTPQPDEEYPDPLTIPSVPMTDLSPEQLLVTAQVVYTALLKVYLLVRPVLVGSLCRIENWCEVEEVEELLKAREKYGDLIDLYQGKKMHQKALALLQELAKKEDDRLDKYPPTIRYLQKLGPDYLDLIFDNSKWVFDEDPKTALQIFTADEPEVEALPRDKIVKFLSANNSTASVGYLEHIINDLGDASPDFHDKLAELYLGEVKNKSKAKDQDAKQAAYEKLLVFLRKSDVYRADRLLGKLSNDDHYEARAILLGRLGNHEGALQIYVYRLENYAAAEEYCAHVFQSEPDPLGIFLLLLRIYLRPKSASAPVLLEPALALIAKHGIRLDALQVLDLIPPLVTMAQVQSFFVKTLRDGHRRRNEARVIKDILKARKEQVERGLMGLQKNRVKITDSRICPQCHKRLGQSVIAVHAPNGEVTHYQCKDAFSAKLARTHI